MRNQTFTLTQATAFETEACCSCGVVFAMTAEFRASRLRDKREWYCPNGHKQWYVGKTDAEKAREAEQALRKAELKLQAEMDQRQAADRELKRLQQRSKGGACPCCNRTFVQLARHIKSQHPEYQP